MKPTDQPVDRVGPGSSYYDKCFLTGSHAYGTPTKDSDIDLVLALSPRDTDTLRRICEDGVSDPPGSVSLKFGKINLIIPTSTTALEIWREGTLELILKNPVTRDEAVALFRKMRIERGIEVPAEIEK